MRFGGWKLRCFAVLVACTPVFAQQGMTGGEWRAYGGDLGSTKYSALDQITRENVKDLEIAWRWASVDNVVAAENDGITPFIYEATPIVVNDVMYTSTSLSQVAAIDPATGETKWVFDPGSWKDGRPANLGFVHRGVAYWSDGAAERIYIGTGNAMLWAIDAKTGKPDVAFGDGGRVDLKAGLRRPATTRRYSVSSPPIVCRDVVVVGSSISDGPRRKEMPPGDVRAFDVRTGALKWTFHNPPLEGETGHDSWKDGAAEYTGNANVWSIMSADDELGYIYLPFGTATNDWYGGHRKGDDLFAESLVCVEAETGKRVWHFQMAHHGLWDYDLPAAPTLLDVTVDGKAIKAIAQVTKQGFVFVFDRVTGKPVWPIEERAVPQSTAEGEETSPTQPFPTRPAPYEVQGMSPDMLIDFTPELRAEALKILETYNYGPLYTPPLEGKATIYNPGYNGGANWMGCAADPETGMIYIPSMTGPINVELVRPNADVSNFTYIGRNNGNVPGPRGLPLLKPPYGKITAIDLNTGEHAWVRPLGDGPIRHPALRNLNLPPLGDSTRQHPLVTKTLLFVGQSNFGRGGGGRGPANFRALDKATGEIVWAKALKASITATPMTYMAGGKQFIAFATGGMGPASEIVAVSLP